ncbi:MAG: 50S ribosomal protein L11 methyltransferase [Deltaproteobacteria bacterium]|nr:50S ribosomal protein L11 methyltransferase [Deltaproteobacteria bacterium]
MSGSVTREQVEAHLQYVQDLDLPHELFTLLADARRIDAYEAAIARALAPRPNARVVCCGPGALLWSMMAASAGATVVVAESGVYFAPLIRDVVADNGLSAQVTVIQGCLYDLPETWRHGAEVVILESLDSALFGHGLLANARWARKELLAPGGALIPARARLTTAPGELLLGPQCGFDLRPVDDYRGVAPNEAVALVTEGWRQLATPCESASVDFAMGVETVAESITFRLEETGTLNTLATWYSLDLDGVSQLDRVSQLDNSPAADDPRREQGVSFFDEPVDLEVGQEISFSTTLSGATGLSFVALGRGHVRTYGRVRPTLPTWHFPMLADPTRNEAFVGAIERALTKHPHGQVLDIGAGSGLLTLAAARAGAKHVTACEMVPHVADLARTCVARNGAEARVDIVADASFDLSVPEDMPQKASLLVSETVDHALLGESFLIALAHAREELLTADAQVIPAAATLCMTPVDLHTGRVGGFDLRTVDQLRFGHYLGLRIVDGAHILLAKPHPIYHFDFQSGEAEAAQTCFEVPITQAGVCSGVALSFEMQVDAETALSTAPGSEVTAWDQGMIFFDQNIDVSPGETLPIWCNHDLEGVVVYPDPDFLREHTHRIWPRRQAIWAMGLRAEAANRTVNTEALARVMHAASATQLLDIWQALMVDDPELCWLRRDLLAELYAQLGYEL